MKLTKGKINRIINKKKYSKNIKKRKYKRTDTCNNKAKRHLANRTLKCYKSKGPTFISLKADKKIGKKW